MSDKPRVNRIFEEGLDAYLSSSGRSFPRRIVRADEVSIPREISPDAEKYATILRMIKRGRRKHLNALTSGPIPVLERPGGILEAWDDTLTIAALHEASPGTRVEVVIVGFDPTPVK